jgi:ferredoxin
VVLEVARQGERPMRVVIDSAVCQGHLRCMDTAPSLFDADDLGHGLATDRELELESEIEAARRAVLSCPERAIRLET